MRPIDPIERVELIDALRGFALFGVCLANLFVFSYATPDFFTETLVEGKFYSIFSLLFGLGFALQLRDEQRLPMYRRRTKILMLIGLAHLLLLWFGDILLFYALVGLVLMRMRNISDEKAVRYAAVFLLMPVVQYVPSLINFLVSPAMPFFLGAFGMSKLYHFDIMKSQDLPFVWSTSGNIVDWFKLTTTGIWFRYADLMFTGRPWKVLAMFLLGMVVGKRRMWENLELYGPLLKRVAFWGLIVGLPANVALALYKNGDLFYKGTVHGIIESALYAIAVAPLALGFAASFALLWQTRARTALRVFAPAGKMALTNYLSQTIIATLIFSGFGLNLAKQLSPQWLWAEAVLTLAFQITLSALWLSRYRFGPMEWVWRSLTYRQAQPMRVQRIERPVLAS
jgi:uncharacterized protein